MARSSLHEWTDGTWGRTIRLVMARTLSGPRARLIRDHGRVRGDAPADHHRAAKDVRRGEAREAATKRQRDQGERPASRAPDQTGKAQDRVSPADAYPAPACS